MDSSNPLPGSMNSTSQLTINLGGMSMGSSSQGTAALDMDQMAQAILAISAGADTAEV